MTASKELHLQLSREQQGLLEDWLLDFEQDWSSAALDDWQDRLNSQPALFSQAALVELIKVDLERRWQTGDQVTLESYMERFAALENGDSIPLELIQAEIEVRRQFGATVELAELLERFPSRGDELRQVLDTVPTRYAVETSQAPGVTVAFIEGYSYRLPAEMEWEFACRTGTQTRWSCGDNEQELPQYGWFNSKGAFPALRLA